MYDKLIYAYADILERRRYVTMDDKTLDFVKRLAKAMAAQFGGNCEVVVHDLNTGDPERTIAAIENGHVSRRRVGD